MSDGGKSFAAFGLRMVLGTSMLLNGAQKFGAFGGDGMSAFSGRLDTLGIIGPEAVAYVVAIAQVIAGVLLFSGCFHKWASGIAITISAFAIYYQHGGHYFGERGYEYLAALIAIGFSIFFNGPGPMAYKIEFKKTKS